MPQYTVRDEASGKVVTFDWAGAEPPGETDLAEVFAEVTQPVPSHNSAGPEPRTWTDTAVDALPAVGGSIGGLLGLVGGPAGAVAGAAVGGAGGEGWRRTIQGLRGKRPQAAQESIGDTLKGVATEGAIQGGAELVGGLAAKGLTKAGARLYRGLLKPSRAIQSGFGGDDVVRTLLDEGATISEKGLAKASGALSGSRAAALKLVEDAAPTSTMVRPQEVLREFRPVVETLRKRAAVGQADELAKVGARGKALVKRLGQGAGVDAAGAQTLKETAQDAASGAYRLLERGGAKQLGADDLLDEAVARGFRKAVETRVPGVAAQNQTTQRLLGGTRALEQALERGANNNAVGGMRDLIAAGIGTSVAGPPGAGLGVLTRLLATPRPGSAVAIGLDRVGKSVPLDDLLRALDLLREKP